MLTLQDVHAAYGSVEALKGISLEVRQGEIVTLIGANGAGKTTTLMSICGEPAPRSGSIRFEGEEISGLPTPVIMRRGLAIVPEGRRIFPALTVEENLALGGFHQSAEERAAAEEEIYALFPRLKERYRQRGGTLSGGEQQMLAIGRALMSRPRLLLLDEPSLGLAPLVIAQMFEVLEEIRRAGPTIFLVEENAHRALQLADRAYVLEDGRIVMSGEGRELLANDEVRRAYLGA